LTANFCQRLFLPKPVNHPFADRKLLGVGRLAPQMRPLPCSSHAALPGNWRRPASTIGALGVVFGDIGTSPLYTLRECLGILCRPAERAAGVLGVLSLVFWALILVVSVKYVCASSPAPTIAARAAFSPCSPESRRAGQVARRRIGIPLVILLLIGAAPALWRRHHHARPISVLSAVEGLTW
jgi:KUP system potassium uptake protein